MRHDIMWIRSLDLFQVGKRWLMFLGMSLQLVVEFNVSNDLTRLHCVCDVISWTSTIKLHNLYRNYSFQI